MVTVTQTFEVEVTYEGSSEDGADPTSIRLILGRDWKTKSWLYSESLDLNGELANMIAVSFQDDIADLIRDAEAEQVSAKLDAEQQKADDRWSERGLRCD